MVIVYYVVQHKTIIKEVMSDFRKLVFYLSKIQY